MALYLAIDCKPHKSSITMLGIAILSVFIGAGIGLGFLLFYFNQFAKVTGAKAPKDGK